MPEKSQPKLSTIVELDPAETSVSPLNPRKTLGAIDELVESVRDHGVIEPAIGRTTKTGTVELVIGQRRRAAAIAAGRKLPVILRSLSDDEALDLALAENLERNDLDPLEEAEAYQLRLERGQTVEHVAERIGRGVGYVSRRLKLLELGKEAKAALARGEISVTVAELIGRIPAKLQKKALERVGGTRWQRSMSAAEAAKELRAQFMLRLADATFDRGDATLVPKAGACSVCPHRTGNQAELFADVDSPDLCTVPDCYAAKVKAAGARALAAAKKEGKQILAAAETKKVFSGYDGEISYAAKYRDLADTVYASPSSTAKTPIKKLLGADAEITYAVNPKTGALHALVSKAAVDAALRKRKGSKKESESEKAAAKREKAERAKQKAKAEIRDRVDARAIANAVAEIEAHMPAVRLDALLRLVVGRLAWSTEGADEVAKRRASGSKVGHVDVARVLNGIAAKASTPELCGLVYELALRELAAIGYGTKGDKELEAALALAGVDRKVIEKAVLEEAETDVKPVKPKAKSSKASKASKAKPAARSTKRKPTPASAEDGSDTVCRDCGCSDLDPCPGGCEWVEPDLCSACADAPERTGTRSKPRGRRALPAKPAPSTVSP